MVNKKTENRINKFLDAIKNRQLSLSVLLENIHDPHNVSAIARTCDAVGIANINLLYYIEKLPKLSVKVSKSALKWVDYSIYTDIDLCFDSIKKEGYKIYTSHLDPNSISLYDLDLTEKVIFVMGNENRGVSERAIELSDKTFYIPMKGMVQSLNVSVAASVCLYEAYRQREAKNMYKENPITQEEINLILNKWCEKKNANSIKTYK